MDIRTIFGGNPLGVVIRLIVLSIVVGIVLSVLGFTPQNFFEKIDFLIRRLYDLGFGAVDWLLQYMLIGAMVVIPIWLIARLLGAFRKGPDDTPV